MGNKNISSLIGDIYATVEKEGWWTPDLLGEFHLKLSGSINQKRGIPSLRLSKMGEQCPSALWHSVHSAEHAERIQPWVYNKFNYGHILEAYVISLAKASGHEVTGEQDELILDGIKGHRDCVIDGCVVDVKSLNSLGFQKVRAGDVAEDIFLRDYLDQLDGYVVASADDPLVRTKDRGYILAIDKTLGHLTLYEHIVREGNIRDRIRYHREISLLRHPPKCNCGTLPDGTSGNIKLDLKASYNLYKFCCHPHLRTFIYAKGPVYLTKVVRLPDVTEVDRFGKVVYNS